MGAPKKKAKAETPPPVTEAPETTAAHSDWDTMDFNGVLMVKEAQRQIDALLLAVENLRDVSCPEPEDFDKVMEPLREARSNIRVALEHHLEPDE
jgi:hypothetical protein